MSRKPGVLKRTNISTTFSADIQIPNFNEICPLVLEMGRVT